MADFFYLLAIPLAVGGLLAMPSSDDDRPDRMRVVLDGVIVACVAAVRELGHGAGPDPGLGHAAAGSSGPSPWPIRPGT